MAIHGALADSASGTDQHQQYWHTQTDLGTVPTASDLPLEVWQEPFAMASDLNIRPHVQWFEPNRSLGG